MRVLKNMVAVLIKAFRTLMPSCREAIRLQSQSLDGGAHWLRRPGLIFHILACKWCRRYGRQIQFLRAAGQQSDSRSDSSSKRGLTEEARQRIKLSLNSHHPPSASSGE